MANHEPRMLLNTIRALTRPRGFESHALRRGRLPGCTWDGPSIDGAARREPACLLPDDRARVVGAGRLQGGSSPAIGIAELAD
jgi:hypothetical protein